MVFWLSLNCQNYLSYCSKNGHKWTCFPKIFFLANVLPTKINQNTTKSLKNLGTILLTQARYCSLAMMKKQKTYVNWDSAAILQLFLSYVWTILQPFCSYFAAILQLFCSYFAAILWLFWSYFADILQLFWSYLPGLWFGFAMFFLFSQGFYKVWVGTSWVSTRISLGSLWVWKIKKNHRKPYGKQLYDLHFLFVSRIAFSRSPRATSHDWCRKELDPIKITRKPAVFLTKRVRCFQSPIFYVCQSAGDWLGHCVLCDNVMMHRAHVHIYIYTHRDTLGFIIT